MAVTVYGGGGGIPATVASPATTTNTVQISNGCNCAWWDVVCLAQCAGSDIANAFENAPTYITHGVLPYLQTIPVIGSTVAGIESQLPDISASLGAFAPAIESIPAIGAGVATIGEAVQYVPEMFHYIQNTLTPNVAALLGAFPNIESEVQNIPQILHTLETGFQQAQQYLSELVQVPTNVNEILQLSEEIQHDVGQFPVDITSLEDYMGAEIVSLEKWMQTNLPQELQQGIGNIEQGITTIEQNIQGIESQLKNLPQNVEKYVEQGVDTALKNLWKKIEIPVIAIGGLAFLMWAQPSDCCPRKEYRPHISGGV